MSTVLLIVSTAAYAVGIVLQATAAGRAERRAGVDLGLLARLARDRVYLGGLLAQALGFGAAFFARADLPLYLVQAAATSAVGLAALGGVVFLGWRLGRTELAALAVLGAGLLLVVGATETSTAAEPGTPTIVALAVTLVLVVVLAVASAAAGTSTAGFLGVLAGVAFGVLSVAARPVADEALTDLLLRPAWWLVVVSAVVGQALFAAALHRGSATVAAASMDAGSMLIAGLAGALVLGDRVVDGRVAWAVAGSLLVLASVVALSRCTSPPSPTPPVDRNVRDGETRDVTRA